MFKNSQWERWEFSIHILNKSYPLVSLRSFIAVVICFTFLGKLEPSLGVQEDTDINHKAAQLQQRNTFLPKGKKKHLCEITFLLYFKRMDYPTGIIYLRTHT